MTKHNGWGATSGGGRLPKPSFSFDVPRLDPMFIKFAHQAKSLAAELKIPVLNVIERARLEGHLECDDTQALSIADFADKLKPARIDLLSSGQGTE